MKDMKLLILSTIQSNKLWQQDCHNIAMLTLQNLNYNLPNNIYKNYFINFLIPLIAEKSILTYSTDSIESALHHLEMEAGHDSYASYLDNDYYQFDKSIKTIVEIHNAIEESITQYYAKSDLKSKLDSLPENTVLIYPKSTYRHLLMKAFPNTYPKFNCTTNKPTKMLQEFEIMTGFKQYEIIKL